MVPDEAVLTDRHAAAWALFVLLDAGQLGIRRLHFADGKLRPGWAGGGEGRAPGWAWVPTTRPQAGPLSSLGPRDQNKWLPICHYIEFIQGLTDAPRAVAKCRGLTEGVHGTGRDGWALSGVPGRRLGTWSLGPGGG